MAYEKQTWINGETVATAEKMNHIEDGIEKANEFNSIHLYKEREYDINITEWQQYTIRGMELKRTKGNKLYFEDGRIKVGAGVKVVGVSATLSVFSQNVTGDFESFVMKSGSNIRSAYGTAKEGEWRPFTIPVTYIDVIEGDSFELAFMCGVTGRYNVLYANLTVEVIE